MKLICCGLFVLLLQQIGSEHIPSKYKLIFEIYGENLENLQPGDILEKNDFDLVLIFDHQNFFQMDSYHKISPEQREIWCSFYPYPRTKEDAWRMGRLIKIGEVPNPKVTYALAKRLADKWLPYHPDYCRKRDWMKYILYGQVKKSVYWNCPLEASLEGVDEKQIEEGKFLFRNKQNHHYHDFLSLNDPKYFVRAQRDAEKVISCFELLWLKVKRCGQRRYNKRLRWVASSSARIADSLDKKITAEKSKELASRLS